ncbi:MAG: PhzF family phenazine biosynthesis protein [Solirubrobacteraceae bacterium]
MRRFRQVDVFSAGGPVGNPVAVVVDSEGLNDEEMQTFARWTNLSETTFLLAPTDAHADYRVRIFTPQHEMPFAGHPTLGSCHAWLETHPIPAPGAKIVQECKAGLVRLRRSDNGLAFVAPPLRRSGPLDPQTTEQIAQMLRLSAEDILDGAWVDNGAGWAGVLLRNAEMVLALQPTAVEIDIGVIGPHPSGQPADFEVRAFYPKDGSTAEDPVTGSLNAGLAEWLIACGRATAPYQVRQGTAIGHDGRVFITQDEAGSVWVAGTTTTLITGTVDL